MKLDMREQDDELCKNLKQVAIKKNMPLTFVCDDEDAEELATDGAVQGIASPDCENLKEVASKYGKTMVCDDGEKM